MPESLIVIKAEDKYSIAIKKMSDITKSFCADQDRMEEKLKKLTVNQRTLQGQMKESGDKLKELHKQFDGTGDAIGEMAIRTEQARFDNLKRNLGLVTKGAREAERQMQKTGKAFSQTSNRAEGDNGMGQVFGEGGWSWTHKKAPSRGRGDKARGRYLAVKFHECQ